MVTAVFQLISGKHFLLGVLFGLGGLGLSFLLRSRKPDWGVIWALAAVGALVSSGAVRFRPGELFTDPYLLVLAVGAATAAAAGIFRMAKEIVIVPAVVVSLGGIWATVPDTEKIGVLIGVTAAMLWAWFITRWAHPTLIGAVAIGILAVWAAAGGGVGRTTGLIGGLGSMATLGLSAYVLPVSKPGMWLVTHLAVVLVWSRWAGLTNSVPLAMTIGLTASIAAVAIGIVVKKRESLGNPSAG